MIASVLASELGGGVLHSIAWTLTHSVWQFTLFAALLALGLRLMRGVTSHIRYGLMSATILVMALTPVATYCVVDSSAESLKQTAQNAATEAATAASRSQIDGTVSFSPVTQNLSYAVECAVVDLPPVPIDSATPGFGANLVGEITSVTQRLVARWMNVILLGWLIGMSLLSIRPLVGWRVTRRLRFCSRTSVPDSVAAAATRVAKCLGVGRAVEIAQSSLVDVPTVIGWFKPLVLLPASAVSGMTTEQIEAVVAHELAHVRRHDYVVNLFQLAMETVFFFHPAVWWVSHLMRREREECCDDIAVQMTGDRVGYVKLLVWLEESRNGSAIAVPGAFGSAGLGMSARGGSLVGRVRRILSPSDRSASPMTSVLVVGMVVAVAGGLFWSVIAHDSSAQTETTNAAVSGGQEELGAATNQQPANPPGVAEIRRWMHRAIELKEWGRLTMLAKQLAEAGEYEEALSLLSKAPLGRSREGKLTPKFYYEVIGEICEIALEHDRLDVADRVLNQLTDPELQTAANKQFPPQVSDIRLAILQHHISNGEIDNALTYLRSRSEWSRVQMIGLVARRMPRLGYGDQVEAFRERLTDPKLLSVCEHSLANSYYHLHQPEKIWQLADRIAEARPDDLIAEIRARQTAMVYYGKMAPQRFDERLSIFRDKLLKLPMEDQTRYWKSLALSAAKSHRYELVAELSASVPLLLQSERGAMDLSGTDHHPVLYAITLLHKQRQFEQALVIIDDVKDDAVVLAALARLANLSLEDDGSEVATESYRQIIERLTLAYNVFSAKHDELTVRDVSRRLPEMMSIHLRRTTNPLLPSDSVRYLDREQLLITGTHFDVLLQQGKADELVRHVEALMDDGNLRGARWIVNKVAEAGDVEAFERLSVKFNQLHAVAVETDPKSMKSVHKIDVRGFWARLAQNAYSAGQRDRCFELFMEMDRNWRNPLPVSRVANLAREAGDLEFLHRMENSGSPQMREAALRVLALHYVSVGDIDAARDAANAFDREFRSEHSYWTIYRVITDDKNVKDPASRFAAIEMVLEQLAVDSDEYATIATQYAKLLRQLYPGKPLPEGWLKKLDFDPSLRLKVELQHRLGE